MAESVCARCGGEILGIPYIHHSQPVKPEDLAHGVTQCCINLCNFPEALKTPEFMGWLEVEKVNRS